MDNKIDSINELHGNESQRIFDFLTKMSEEMKEIKASVQEVQTKNVQEQKIAGGARKEAVKMEDFFKQKFARRGPKVLQEVHVDEIEESAREKLWKKYGDYRGKYCTVNSYDLSGNSIVFSAN